MKSIFIGACAVLLMGGCAPAQPDLTPIGEGLKAIGVALVVFGVVGALADLIRSGGRPTTTRLTTPSASRSRTSVSTCSANRRATRLGAAWKPKE